MATYHDYLLVLLVVVTCWCSCHGLHCWSCNTKKDGEACGDPFNATQAEAAGITQINCTVWAEEDVKIHPFNIERPPVSCFKSYSYHTNVVETQKKTVGTITRRECSFVDKDYSDGEEGAQGGSSWAWCKTDGCNHGNAMLASATLVLALLGATVRM